MSVRTYVQVDTVEDLMLVFPNFLQHRVRNAHTQTHTQSPDMAILISASSLSISQPPTFHLLYLFYFLLSSLHLPPFLFPLPLLVFSSFHSYLYLYLLSLSSTSHPLPLPPLSLLHLFSHSSTSPLLPSPLFSYPSSLAFTTYLRF